PGQADLLSGQEPVDDELDDRLRLQDVTGRTGAVSTALPPGSLIVPGSAAAGASMTYLPSASIVEPSPSRELAEMKALRDPETAFPVGAGEAAKGPRESSASTRPAVAWPALRDPGESWVVWPPMPRLGTTVLAPVLRFRSYACPPNPEPANVVV